MTGPSFARLRRLCPPFSPHMLYLYVVAALSVLTLLSLLIVLACAVHTLFSSRSELAPTALVSPMLDWALLTYGGANPLWSLLQKAAFLGGVFFLCSYLLEYGVQTTALAVAARLRHDVHRHTFHLGGADVLGRPESSPVQLFTEEVERVRRGLVAWWSAVPRAVLLLGGLMALALHLHVWLALSATLLALLLWMIGTWMVQRAGQRRVLLADRAAIHMSALVEGLKHSRLVSGYLLEDAPGAPLGQTMPRYLKHAQQLELNGRFAHRLLQFAVFLAGLAMLGLVGVNVLSRPPQLAPAEAALLFVALCCAARPLLQLVRLRTAVQEAEPASDAILAYLHHEPRVREFADAPRLAALAQQLRLEDVLLRDATGHVLLEKISLALPARGRVAIVSSDRAASLALACLFPRFYDPDAGRVLYDGEDLRSVTLKSLRSQVALVLQDGLLFSASVHDNIVCGDFHLDEAAVREAAKLLGADDFILRLPQGFDTLIGENGIRLSPGESLLVGLCRAVVRNPSVLIVEEPLEELEPDEALWVDHAVGVAAQERSLLWLATRLETLRTAEQVCLLHEGRIQAAGSHADLLQQSDLYRHVIYMRFNEFRNHTSPQREIVHA
jgi:ABC-type multidrug transport system fused ATPase/permease subunit